MKKIFAGEMRKMLRSRTLLWSTLIGMAISFVNVIENYFLTQWYYEIQEAFYTPGYQTLSIIHNWIDGAQMTVGETIFFTVFPLLAALPFSWSLWNEKHSGYTNQVLIRTSQKKYLLAKYTTTFLSGGIAVSAAMVFNFMANAWILPLCDPPLVQIGGGYGMFLSHLLFTRPKVYLLLCLITCFFWAGTLACMALTVSLFSRSVVVGVLAPFALLLGGSFLIEGLMPIYSEVQFLGRLESSPMQLLHAMTLNSNPAWYVWSILLGLLGVVSAVYFIRGMHDEML